MAAVVSAAGESTLLRSACVVHFNGGRARRMPASSAARNNAPSHTAIQSSCFHHAIFSGLGVTPLIIACAGEYHDYMGLFEIGIVVLLFLFLAIMTLMINPPEKWVRRLTDPKNKDNEKS